MFELEILTADFIQEVNVITVEAKLTGIIDGPLVKMILIDKEQTEKKFILKGPMFLDGPNVKRSKDHLYLAFDSKGHTIEDILGKTLVPLTE